MSDALTPYPWNPWVEVNGKLHCQFCASPFDDAHKFAHRSYCGWFKRWTEVNGTATGTRQLLTEEEHFRNGPG